MWRSISNGTVVVLLFAAASPLPAFAEDVTLTTYYPSPRGAYKELRVTDNAATTALFVQQTGAGAAVRVDDIAGDPTPFVIEAGGDVGVGVAAPGVKLDVVGTGGNTVDLRVTGRIRTGDAANNGGVWLGSDNTGFVGEVGANIGFWTNGVSWNALQINKANGNVGLGTTAPGARLDVVGTGSATVDLRVNGRIRTGDAARNGGIWLGVDNTGFVGETGGNIGFWTNGVSWNALQIIKANGNVGLGTVAPRNRLDVAGAMVVGSAFAGVLAAPADSLMVQGRVGIGVLVPQATLHVNRNIIVETTPFFGATTDDGYIDFVQSGVRKGNVWWDISSQFLGISGFGNNTVLNFNVPTGGIANGNVGIGLIAPAYTLHVNGTIAGIGITNLSDGRLKKDVHVLSDALSRVMALRGVSFTWKREEFPKLNLPAGTRIGLIGQEVERILPEAVSEDGAGHLTVQYDNVIPLLIEAVKEQQAEIQQLQQDLTELQRQQGGVASSVGEAP